MKEFKRILIANRGEIAIRVIRAVQELGMKAVSVYCEEDKLSLFRSKADEAYMIKSIKTPTDSYLNIEAIIDIALSRKIDAIHPGYGFLAENHTFAKVCNDAGIKFIGPTPEVIDLLGNKVNAKIAAVEAGVPVIEGAKITNAQDALAISEKIGYPVMIKAAAGGGGRGMRVCERAADMPELYEAAVREALKAFGDGEVFIEKYIASPRHVEVQILGDEHGNIVHLYERDCSIQRRHQKVIEFSPCMSISEETREKICGDALKLAKHVGYTNAGTVEFLLDNKDNHYFIEVNPRIQVEHTVTELVCGIDLVQSQILIAQGMMLSDPEIGIRSQSDITFRGAAIECRITTENVMNNFMPDTGKIEVYKTGSGPGVRLDGGNGFTGAVISPYFDSLLVKTTTYDRSFDKARRKMIRAMKEHVIEGVKTNKDFLINVLEHDVFKQGRCDTTFIDKHPELFNLKLFDDREYKLLKFIAEKSLPTSKSGKPVFEITKADSVASLPRPEGTKQIFDRLGAQGIIDHIKSKKELLFMDTTMRDAHQSLSATRMRTVDMVEIAETISKYESELYALEMWGGATFDTAYRFLKESPWTRLKLLREKIPNIMFQMLLRSSNAVGYTNYPDNLIREFIKCSAESGIDAFRIFDSLNWLEQIKVSCEEVLKQGKIAEVAICYTGDITDPRRPKYDLRYYLDLARRLEDAGAHVLGIKDMAGLCKPAAASLLVRALREEVGIPVHFHTHDTSGISAASVLAAADAGVDAADAAMDPMSGLTSQPNLGSIVEALRGTPRDTGLQREPLAQVAAYWEAVRRHYQGFESDMRSGAAEVYEHEMPGGQYTNLRQQARALGIESRWRDVARAYASVNEMFGDIVKVTPTSKVVGDLAVFMVTNDLTPEEILDPAREIIWQIYGGFQFNSLIITSGNPFLRFACS